MTSIKYRIPSISRAAMMPPSPSLRATLLALGCPTVILDIYLFIFLECLAKLIMTDTLDTGWKTFYLIFLCILWQPGVKGLLFFSMPCESISLKVHWGVFGHFSMVIHGLELIPGCRDRMPASNHMTPLTISMKGFKIELNFGENLSWKLHGQILIC